MPMTLTMEALGDTPDVNAATLDGLLTHDAFGSSLSSMPPMSSSSRPATTGSPAQRARPSWRPMILTRGYWSTARTDDSSVPRDRSRWSRCGRHSSRTWSEGRSGARDSPGVR